MEHFAVTVGVFDGVHRGHKAILDVLAEEAGRRGLRTAALTFDPHPDQVVRGRKVPLLTTVEERVELLAQLGIDRLRVLSFDSHLRDTSHEMFVREVLVGEMGCRLLVVGPGFALGRGRAGTPETLADLGERIGFEFRQAEPVLVRERTVSSTWIREVVSLGEMRLAAELLGRAYSLRGRVVTGAGRGREIGYPTANIRLPEAKLSPGPGTYGGAVWIQGVRRPAAVNIGFRPTFRDSPGGEPVIEAHIIDFEGDIGGEEIEIQMLARLRDERHFGTRAALADQIARDVEQVRRIVEDDASVPRSGPSSRPGSG